MAYIYKYGPLSMGRDTIVAGRIVHVGYQNFAPTLADGVFVWAELHGPNDPVSHVKIFPTGNLYNGEYIGTAIEPNGLVWHVVKEDTP
jgi:hypothetical protein